MTEQQLKALHEAQHASTSLTCACNRSQYYFKAGLDFQQPEIDALKAEVERLAAIVEKGAVTVYRASLRESLEGASYFESEDEAKECAYSFTQEELPKVERCEVDASLLIKILKRQLWHPIGFEVTP